MKPTCPHCNTELSTKTKLRVFKDVRKGTISPRRKCPTCNNWMTKKTEYVIAMDVIFIGYMLLFFFRVIPFYIAVILFFSTLILYELYAPYQKYNKR